MDMGLNATERARIGKLGQRKEWSLENAVALHSAANGWFWRTFNAQDPHTEDPVGPLLWQGHEYHLCDGVRIYPGEGDMDARLELPGFSRHLGNWTGLIDGLQMMRLARKVRGLDKYED